MDASLPGKLDGIKAAFYMSNVFNIPVIFISEKRDEGIINQALSAGPYGFVTIPFNNTTIITNCSIAIANHEMMRRLTGFEDRFELAAQGPRLMAQAAAAGGGGVSGFPER